MNATRTQQGPSVTRTSALKEPQASHHSHTRVWHMTLGTRGQWPPTAPIPRVREKTSPAALLLHLLDWCLGRQALIDVIRECRPAAVGGARGVSGLLLPAQLEDLLLGGEHLEHVLRLCYPRVEHVLLLADLLCLEVVLHVHAAIPDISAAELRGELLHNRSVGVARHLARELRGRLRPQLVADGTEVELVRQPGEAGGVLHLLTGVGARQ
mmetsp:Transcript_64573/g.155774  ORF Transcript_64573/g.155774 Transcript_64573/m.155774 type:complete len:211 (+) Transcript_64573:11-643(+)